MNQLPFAEMTIIERGWQCVPPWMLVGDKWWISGFVASIRDATFTYADYFVFVCFCRNSVHIGAVPSPTAVVNDDELKQVRARIRNGICIDNLGDTITVRNYNIRESVFVISTLQNFNTPGIQFNDSVRIGSGECCNL